MRATLALLVCLLAPAAAHGQVVVIGLGLGASTQRFDDPPDLNRLNGTSAALDVAGGVLIRSVFIRVGASIDFAIGDDDELPLSIHRTNVTLHSTLQAHKRPVGPLRCHRVGLSYL